jgi:RNA polymerase primary sigma factor
MVDAKYPLRNVTPDALSAYLEEVRRTRLLTPEEENVLGHRVTQGDETAVQQLVEHNLRFVVQVARKYQGYGVPLADLINEGNIGLLHAARKFDPIHGTRFITYAVWWIRQAIMQALAEGGAAVRLPIKQAEVLAKVRRTLAELQQQQGEEPTVAEVAAALDMPVEQIEALLRAARPHLSLDAPIYEEGGAPRLNLLHLEQLPSSEDVYVQASLIQEVRALLEQLEPREAAILRARFGFEGPPKNRAEIGRELGLSRERIRQLEARAQAKLLALAREKALEHYLN